MRAEEAAAHPSSDVTRREARRETIIPDSDNEIVPVEGNHVDGDENVPSDMADSKDRDRETKIRLEEFLKRQIALSIICASRHTALKQKEVGKELRILRHAHR